MAAIPQSLSLTPHGRLVLVHDADAPPLESGLADRLQRAFERGSGHGLPLPGAGQAGTLCHPSGAGSQAGPREASREGAGSARGKASRVESRRGAAPETGGGHAEAAASLILDWRLESDEP